MLLPETDDPERLRREAGDRPGSPAPWLHLGATVSSGAALIAASALLLRDVRWWDLVFAAAVAVLANSVEWRLHRDVLHRARALATVLHRHHAELHHRVYVIDDMAVRGAHEWRLVLLRPWAVLAIAAALSPVSILLWVAGQRNLGALFALVSTAYVLGYELSHLLCHLPSSSRWLRALARHHALHHDPRLAGRWNFNVTLPLWDFVRGTRRAR